MISAPNPKFETREGGPANLDSDLGPLAMSYDEKKGWTIEILGPTSRHWKRLAREVKTRVAHEGKSPTIAKQEGPIPLQELDPNICDLKHKKGRKELNQTLDGEKQMDGDVAVVAKQHR